MRGTRTSIEPYLFVAPALLWFGAFVLVPLLQSLYYGFTQWNGVADPVWIGIANYRAALRDTVFRISFVNNLLYIAATLLVEVAFGFGAALLLGRKEREFGLLRTLFFSPMVLSMVAVGILWNFAYDHYFGIVNGALRALGLGGLARPWLADPSTALWAVSLVSGWRYAGFYMAIFHAALQRIPPNLLEAASIDGAHGWAQIRYIVLPLLRQSTLTSVLICVTGGFAAFDLFYTMTNGGPYHATEIMSTWVIKVAFDRNMLGYGVSLTVIMGILVVLVSLPLLTALRKEGFLEY